MKSTRSVIFAVCAVLLSAASGVASTSNISKAPVSALTHQALQHRDEEHPATTVTVLATTHTTVIQTVVAGFENGQEWTSTIVISGQGTSTDPIGAAPNSQGETSTESHHTSTTTKPAAETTTMTTTASHQTPTTHSPLVPLPTTWVNPSKLSSMLSSLLTKTKSAPTTTAPTHSPASTGGPRSFSTTLGSGGKAVSLGMNLWPMLAGWFAPAFFL